MTSTATTHVDAGSGTGARLGGALRALGVFIASCAVLLVLSAAWDWWQRSEILGNWPVTSATIRSCSLRRSFPFQRNGGGIVFWIRCDLEYSADGSTHSTRLESSTRHAGLSGKVYTLRGGSFVVEWPEQ